VSITFLDHPEYDIQQRKTKIISRYCMSDLGLYSKLFQRGCFKQNLKHIPKRIPKCSETFHKPIFEGYRAGEKSTTTTTKEGTLPQLKLISHVPDSPPSKSALSPSKPPSFVVVVRRVERKSMNFYKTKFGLT
jgi:hypothetical protein